MVKTVKITTDNEISMVELTGRENAADDEFIPGFYRDDCG